MIIEPDGKQRSRSNYSHTPLPSLAVHKQDRSVFIKLHVPNSESEKFAYSASRLIQHEYERFIPWMLRRFNKFLHIFLCKQLFRQFVTALVVVRLDPLDFL